MTSIRELAEAAADSIRSGDELDVDLAWTEMYAAIGVAIRGVVAEAAQVFLERGLDPQPFLDVMARELRGVAGRLEEAASEDRSRSDAWRFLVALVAAAKEGAAIPEGTQ